MEVSNFGVTGKHCRLLRPVRDREGHSHFSEQPLILQEIENPYLHMYLVKFDDGRRSCFPTRRPSEKELNLAPGEVRKPRRPVRQPFITANGFSLATLRLTPAASITWTTSATSL